MRECNRTAFRLESFRSLSSIIQIPPSTISWIRPGSDDQNGIHNTQETLCEPVPAQTPHQPSPLNLQWLTKTHSTLLNGRHCDVSCPGPTHVAMNNISKEGCHSRMEVARFQRLSENSINGVNEIVLLLARVQFVTPSFRPNLITNMFSMPKSLHSVKAWNIPQHSKR